MPLLSLPLQPPLSPMLSKAAAEIPTGEGWHYEPKWDGFRCIVFRDGDEIELASRNERPFTRYFPELLEPLLASLPARCVVDGEIVIPANDDRGLDFDALLQRIHPAESRVRRLAAETPASFVAFDLLALDDDALLDRPLSERHRMLTQQLSAAEPPVYLCPSTTDAAVAQRWFTEFEGAGLDGVVAKRLADPYTPDKRTLIKVKHQRTADCVIAGYRIHKDGNGVGSLLLGLYDDAGDLHHVGVVASFTVKRRAELLAELEPLTHNALDNHPWRDWAEWQTRAEESGKRMPGAGSRWNAGKDLSWVPLRIERVAEVTFGQLQEGRFRHGSQFVRWRPDREPESCRYDQLEVASPVKFATVVGRE
ncbi:MAG TPA: ATP-dependent DNA ligase [Ilumatobacteraceae bacterium]|nr:ATP-dependent DNA ligase [Ilumatobacteraceae bacterium]